MVAGGSLRTQAIVLRRTNYGEADRILQLLTPEGKRGVLARGVRRERSKLAGSIELFAESDVVIRNSRGELGVLTSARLRVFYGRILESYDVMQFAYEAVKQVSRACETVDASEWYDLLSEVLSGLHAGIDLALVETWFYIRVSSLLGHELNLGVDASGDRLRSDGEYVYDDSEQLLRAARGGAIRRDHIKFMRLIASKPIMVLAQVGSTSTILAECLLLARRHASL